MDLYSKDRLLVWLKKISEHRAPSGIEEERMEVIGDIIKKELKFSEIHRDRLGNLYVKFNKNIEQPKIIIMCHVDEIGATVRKITKSGRILISNRGGIESRWLVSRRVKILTSNKKWINGVLLGRTAHAVAASHRNKDNIDIFDVEIYIGAESLDEVKKMGVHIGSPIVFSETLDLLNRDLDNDTIAGHSLDDLIAVVANLLVIGAILEFNPEKLNAQILISFDTREEIGCSGAKFILKEEKPDIAIGVDVGVVENAKGMVECGAELRKGPTIVWQEASGRTIFDYDLVKEITEVSEKLGINYQNGVFQFYGSESGVAQEEFGIPSALIAIPTLTLHNVPEISTLTGIIKTAELIIGWLKEKFTV